MKALPNKLRVAILVQLFAWGPLSGCGKPAERVDGQLVEQPEERTDDQILFDAVVDVFAERGLPVEIEDEKRGLILTPWTDINKEVRHRYVARVLRSNVGLVLTVDSTYERRERQGQHTLWVSAEDPYTVREKRRDEKKMGEAIQARFRALGGGK